MTFLATLITFVILLIESFLCWIFSFTIDLMIISGLLTLLIEIISIEVARFLMTSIILGGCSFPKVFFFLGFSLGWGNGRLAILSTKVSCFVLSFSFVLIGRILDLYICAHL